MNGKELLNDMSYVHSKYVQEAEDESLPQVNRSIRIWRKPVVLAAIIGLMVLLMGSAVVIRTVLAESDLFDFPLADATVIEPEDIHLKAKLVSSGSMRIECQIDGVEYGKHSVYVLSRGPFIIERWVDNSWVELEKKIDDPTLDPDHVLCSGTYDWYVDWSAIYGVLSPGNYRYTAVIVEDVEPVSVEFCIPESENSDIPAMLSDILNGDAYHVRYLLTTEFGSLDNLTHDQKTHIKDEYMDDPFVYEYWKCGDDLLHIVYIGDQQWIGMMYKDGIKYSLDHEGDDRSNPVIGWSQNPDLDLNRLTDWISLITDDLNDLTAQYAPDGQLQSLTRKHYEEKFMDYYDVEATDTHLLEILSTDMTQAARMLGEQNVDVAREFSWEDDRKNLKSLEVAYVNTSAHPVTTASEAIARAMVECTVEHDKILCYRDEKAGMWKVEFQIMYGYQGYQFVYLNDEGITQMVSGLGSKEPLWKELYPDP